MGCYTETIQVSTLLSELCRHFPYNCPKWCSYTESVGIISCYAENSLWGSALRLSISTYCYDTAAISEAVIAVYS